MYTQLLHDTETRHVRGILSLCNLIDHIADAVHHHHRVIDRFLLPKGAELADNNLTGCMSTVGARKNKTRISSQSLMRKKRTIIMKPFFSLRLFISAVHTYGH